MNIIPWRAAISYSETILHRYSKFFVLKILGLHLSLLFDSANIKRLAWNKSADKFSSYFSALSTGDRFVIFESLRFMAKDRLNREPTIRLH